MLYSADYAGSIVAGIVTIRFNGTVLYAYAASDDAYRAHQPNSLLVWTAIEDSFDAHCRYFDFGRTSPGEGSVTSFKKHWGTDEKTLAYYYYPGIPNTMLVDETSRRYQLAAGLWRRMPLPVAQFSSDRIFKYLG